MEPRTRLDPEVLDLLADEPELRAIADAIAETQVRRRRARPVGVLATLSLAAAVVAAIAVWSGGSPGAGGSDEAYAAMGGGEARMLQVRLATPGPALVLAYDRTRGALRVTAGALHARVPAGALPPHAGRIPALTRFGPAAALGTSLLTEYPERARSGRLASVGRPPEGFASLRWVSYRSSLGFTVQVGLTATLMVPSEIVRAGATPVRVSQVSASN